MQRAAVGTSRGFPGKVDQAVNFATERLQNEHGRTADAMNVRIRRWRPRARSASKHARATVHVFGQGRDSMSPHVTTWSPAVTWKRQGGILITFTNSGKVWLTILSTFWALQLPVRASACGTRRRSQASEQSARAGVWRSARAGVWLSARRFSRLTACALWCVEVWCTRACPRDDN